jgi:UDP-GlcNAc3NAcA epimerase
MRIVHVVGARPQFVKLAVLARALDADAGLDWQQVVVHTGQHYDESMSARFFEEFGLAPPARNLAVGSGPHGAQTGQMLAGLETAFAELAPDLVIVYGDTNSTLAGALAAVKMGIPVAHVEAGLRSFNRAMPEEINRVATDHVADLLLAPTREALAHLEREGLAARSHWVGDVMADAVLRASDRARCDSEARVRLGLAGRRFALATVHRAQATEPAVLAGLLQALDECARDFDALVLPLHPRTRAAIQALDPDWQAPPGWIVCEPLGHADMLALVQDAAVVLTDSGGLQKEAFLLGTPCVTLREETEWTESVLAGGNVVAGLAPGSVVNALHRLLACAPSRSALAALAADCYGQGQAGPRIVAALIAFREGRDDD